MSDAEKLRAEGISVTLKDGKEHRLIFDFESYKILEEELGDLAIFVDRTTPKHKQWRIRNVALGMHAALVHEDQPGIMRTRREVMRLLDFKQMPRYIRLLLDAFTQGMPDQDASEDPNANGSSDNSRGNESTS